MNHQNPTRIGLNTVRAFLLAGLACIGLVWVASASFTYTNPSSQSAANVVYSVHVTTTNSGCAQPNGIFHEYRTEATTVPPNGVLTMNDTFTSSSSGCVSVSQSIKYSLPLPTPTPPPTATITAGSTSIGVNQSTQIHATFTFSDSPTGTRIVNQSGSTLVSRSSAPFSPLDYTFTPTSAGTYTLSAQAATGGYPNYTTYASVTVTVTSAQTAPSITQQPAFSSGSLIVGANLTLTAAATGTPAPTIQWQKSTNGVDGWTNVGSGGNNLTFSSLQASDQGYYRIVASNGISPNAISSGYNLVPANVIPIIPSLTGSSAWREPSSK